MAPTERRRLRLRLLLVEVCAAVTAAFDVPRRRLLTGPPVAGEASRVAKRLSAEERDLRTRDLATCERDLPRRTRDLVGCIVDLARRPRDFVRPTRVLATARDRERLARLRGRDFEAGATAPAVSSPEALAGWRERRTRFKVACA